MIVFRDKDYYQLAEEEAARYANWKKKWKFRTTECAMMIIFILLPKKETGNYNYCPSMARGTSRPVLLLNILCGNVFSNCQSIILPPAGEYSWLGGQPQMEKCITNNNGFNRNCAYFSVLSPRR